MIEGQRIFITGGGGFIGSYLCENLVDRNEIVVFDNGHRNAIQHSSVAQHRRLKLVRGDVLQLDQLAAAMDGCDIVIHAAAIAGIDSVVTKRLRTMEVNLFGTQNVLQAASRNSKVKRLLVFSTSEVYGPYVYRGTETEMTTQGAVGDPRWSYAVSKIAAEHLAFAYFDAFGVPVTTVRPFNVYGPRQVGESAIHKFCVNALRNEDLKVTGDGNQIRAWCYVDDFILGVQALLDNESAIGHVFNLGNPKQTSTILALAEMVIRVSGSKSRIVFAAAPMADVEVRVPSIQKAKEMLGFEPKLGLEEGIQRTLNWYHEHEV
jgi:UDP-glucose 4-epimerase